MAEITRKRSFWTAYQTWKQKARDKLCSPGAVKSDENWVYEADFATLSDPKTIEKLERTSHYVLVGERNDMGRTRPLQVGERSVSFSAVMLSPDPLRVVIKGCLPVDLEPSVLRELQAHPLAHVTPILHSFTGSSALVHPWIPGQRMIEYFVFPAPAVLFEEKYAKGGIAEKSILYDIIQLSHAIQELTSRHFCHGNLRASALSFNKEGHLQIGEFANARKLVSRVSGTRIPLVDALQLSFPPLGTVRPPEFDLMLKKLDLGESDERFETVEGFFAKFDVFGAGHVFLELLGETASPELLEILKWMTCPDFELRCDARELSDRIAAILWPSPVGLRTVAAVEEWLCQSWMEYVVDGTISSICVEEVHEYALHLLQTSADSMVDRSALAKEEKLEPEAKQRLPEGVLMRDYGDRFELSLSKVGAKPIMFEKDVSILDVKCWPLCDHGCEALALALPFLSFLRKLDLLDCSIGFVGALALAKSLPSVAKTLEELILSQNKLGSEGVKVLSSSLSFLPMLKTLNLGWNEMGNDGLEALASAASSMSALETLYLGGNKIGDDGAKALALAFPSLSCLQWLHLGCNRIGETGAISLGRSLSCLTALEILALGVNKIGDYGAKEIAKSLPALSRLQKLVLLRNNIGFAGVEYLARTLPPSLVEINWRENQIGDAGCEALARALPRLLSLRELNLGSNSIGPSGAKALSLFFPPSLQVLYLGDNKLGDAGCEALARGLPTALRELCLHRNSISNDSAESLAERLPSLELEKLYLDGNNLTAAGKDVIRASLLAGCGCCF